jgi:hypothetical protein
MHSISHSLSWKRARGVSDEQTRLADGAITDNNAFHVLHAADLSSDRQRCGWRIGTWLTRETACSSHAVRAPQ